MPDNFIAQHFYIGFAYIPSWNPSERLNERQKTNLLCSTLLLRLRERPFAEPIGTPPVHFLEMSHTSSASCLSSLGFGAPVEASSSRTWVTTRRTHLLLNV